MRQVFLIQLNSLWVKAHAIAFNGLPVVTSTITSINGVGFCVP